MWSDLSFETFRKFGGAGVSFDGNHSLSSSSCSSSKEVRFGIEEVKKPGRSSSTSSIHEYPLRERWEILGTSGTNARRKSWSLSTPDTEMLAVRGSTPARCRHRGPSRFHLLSINVQHPGLEVMTSRQYRQTWVKEMIGPMSVWGMKAPDRAMISGGRRFIGWRGFLR